MTRLSLLALFLAACGGGNNGAMAVTTPFTAEHATVFEDGVDFVMDPDVLEGRWRDEWSQELQQRVGWADLVAVLRVHTLRTDTDPEQNVTFRVIGEVTDELWGEAPEDELSLVVREGDAGFESVRSNERRLLNQTFIAYVKWYTTENETIAPHWHLAPATDPVVRRTEFLVRRRRQDAGEDPDRRVIVVEESSGGEEEDEE